jgi:hypothetical protein
MRSVLLKREDRPEDLIVTATSKEKFKEFCEELRSAPMPPCIDGAAPRRHSQ